jgi:5-methylcytosine-specific restriction endonuclease McrA
MSIGKKSRGSISARQKPGSRYLKTSDRIRQAQGNTINAYTEDWQSIKETVKSKDGYTCQKCGIQVLPGTETYSDRVLMVDHKLTVAQGGRTVLRNLWTLCDLCHEKKPGKANKRGASLVRAVADQVRNKRYAKREKS